MVKGGADAMTGKLYFKKEMKVLVVRQSSHLGCGLGYGCTGTRPARRAGKTGTIGPGPCRGAGSWRSYSYVRMQSKAGPPAGAKAGS